MNSIGQTNYRGDNDERCASSVARTIRSPTPLGYCLRHRVVVVAVVVVVVVVAVLLKFSLAIRFN